MEFIDTARWSFLIELPKKNILFVKNNRKTLEIHMLHGEKVFLFFGVANMIYTLFARIGRKTYNLGLLNTDLKLKELLS